MKLEGKRNMILILTAILTSTLLAWAGIRAGADLTGLSLVIGAKDSMVAAAVFGRGYNKKVQAQNGKVPE